MKLYKFDSECLAYKQVPTIRYILFGAGLMLLFFLLTSFIILNDKSKTKLVYTEAEINLITNTSFSKEALANEIKCNKFKYPDIIMAQALLESGHFTSPVYKENNNLFGMRLPVNRYTLATGSNLNHATYNNWKQCVEDRMIYEALFLHGLSRVQYKKYLDRVYAEGSNYTLKLEQIINKNNLKAYFNE